MESHNLASARQVVGRLAPSPTGALHLGNARSFLLAWLSVRQAGGCVVLRIEDIDSPRVKPWAMAATLEDLQWLGLDWDFGPDAAGGGSLQGIPLVQSQRLSRYQEVLDGLIADGVVYRCDCTRSEVAQAASAPHEALLQPLEGPIYPGTCRNRAGSAEKAERAEPSEAGTDFAYRWAFANEFVHWTDQFQGAQAANPAEQLGDFVIARSGGKPAYQLAVVVDDHDMGVNEVLRGDDLLFSTYRQLAIIKHLGWSVPAYRHVPLLVGPDGRRLAKRHGDTRLSFFREAGVRPQAVVGYLAWTLNLVSQPQPVEPRELIGQLLWEKLPRRATVFELAAEMPRLKRLSQ